jgi:serine/threonine-protein kinase RsbW
MRMSVRIRLPREAGSVPAVRRFLRGALAAMRVDRESGADLEIALTEACSNVVAHATGADRFEVRLDVGTDRCLVDVLDNGAGFDTSFDNTRTDPATPGPVSERGRGLQLIRALSENVRMSSSPLRGSLIHFEKCYA